MVPLASHFKKTVTRAFLPIFVIFFQVVGVAQTKVSIASGDWSDPTIWTPAGVPTSANDVLIQANHVVEIVANQACNSLTVGNGSNAQLRFDSGFFGNNGARSLTVNGNLIVSANASFGIYSGIAAHSLTVLGDVTNNGTIDFNSGFSLFPISLGIANVIFTKNGNQNLTGAGALTRISAIVLNMGSSATNVLNVTPSSFAVPAGFLTLTNGTFKYSTGSAINITPFTTAVTIPATAGFWMNSPNSASMTAGVVLSGILTVASGTVNVGDAADESLLYASGTISVTGGALSIAGRMAGNTTANTCVFTCSGGTVTVPSIGSTNTTDSPFNIAATGSQFNFSGGLILINREGGTGNQNLGYLNLAGSGTVNGGTLQIGSPSSPATQIMEINSTALIPNLVLNNSTASASLLTNAMTVTNTIKITLGTLVSNNLGITLGGNWENNGGTFTPGTATVTFNSNSSQSIFRSGGETFNHLLFSGTGTKTFSSSVISNGNFSISSNSPVDVSASNYSLAVKGNFINSGTFTARSGSVVLNGTTTQTIGGNSVTSFYDLTLNNTAGARLTNAQNLLNNLTLSNGTFSTNLQVFTMVSTSTLTARIAPIATTADINGPVRVQRFVPGGSTGWALWGTPISSALSFTDWDDNIAISCPTCPDGYVPNFVSIYSYSEPVTGSYSNSAAYIPMNTINDAIVPNTGYWVYVGDGFSSTNDITVDVTGTVRKGNQTIPLSRTNTGSPSDDGWNLIHNPYPSPISWTALRNGNANVDNAIYTYNADLNGGAGANASYVNGVSSPAVGSGGIGDNIPMSQGFYVHATANTNLTAQESNKVVSNQAYLRESSAQSTINLVRINMKSENAYNFADEVVVYTQAGASSNFETDFDAFKLMGQDPYAPVIEIENGNDLMQINGVAPVVGTYTTSLKTLTGYTGSYTISLTENSFPIGACVNLFDKFTNTSTDLKASSYVFNLEDTTTVARFVLSITLNQLQVTSNLSQPTCQNPAAGQITAIGNSNGPWNYYWKDNLGSPVKTVLNKTTSDTLNGLSNGTYQLDVTTVGGCDYNTSLYTIVEKSVPSANFSCVDTCFVDVDPIVVFNNTSSNSSSQIWNFGDSNTSTVFSPQHQYQVNGNYLVKLIANSPSGCLDTVSKSIVVTSTPVGIKVISFNEKLMVQTLSQNHYVLQQELKGLSSLSYTLTDVQAKRVLEQSTQSVSRVHIDLDLSAFDPGVYFLSLKLNDKTSVIKLTVSK